MFCRSSSSRVFLFQLQQERIWTRVLEKVFEGGGIGEEVPGYGAELRLEDHPLSPEGVSFVFFMLMFLWNVLILHCVVVGVSTTRTKSNWLFID